MADEPRRSGRATKGQHKNASSSPAPNPKPTKTVKTKPPKKSSEPEAAGDDDDEKIRCICGNDNPNDRRAFIECEACTVWQHNICMGMPEDDDDVPDHYFCEECVPKDHVETLEALKRGEKIWEVRHRIYMSEKKMSKSRKGKQGPPGWLKKNIQPTEEEHEDGESEPQAADGTAEVEAETGSKRKRESEVKDESAPLADAVDEKPSRGSRQDKRRKSAAVSSQAASDTETALVDIDKLPSDRQKIAVALSKIVADDIQARAKAGAFRIPDGHTAKSLADYHASRIEYGLTMNHEGPGNPPYMAQFRTLNANLKKNKVLIERLLQKSLTADELSTMSSSEMASEELQKERAAMKEVLDRQAVAVEVEGPRYRRTHKGDELIEDENQHLEQSAAAAQPVRERQSVADGEMGSAASPTNDGPAASPTQADAPPLTVDTKRRPSNAGLDRRASSQQFDMSSIWAKTAQSPTQSSAGPRPMQMPPRRQSSLPQQAASDQVDGTKDDVDVDRMLQDADEDDETYSPAAEYTPGNGGSDASIVWRGKVVQSGDGASPTVNARFVAGRDLTPTIAWRDLLADRLAIDGRLQVTRAEEYLCSLQWSQSSDVSVLALTPYDDAEGFSAVFEYFASRGRYAVVNKDKPAMVKDLYIIPVNAGAELPEHVGMLEYCAIRRPVEEKLLLATFVVARAPGTPAVRSGSQQQEQAAGDAQPRFEQDMQAHLPALQATNGHGLPQHVRTSGAGPAGSPLVAGGATFSPSNSNSSAANAPPQTGYGAVLPPNPYGQQQPPDAYATQSVQPPLNPLVTEILGSLQYAPTAQQVIAADPNIEREKLQHLKLIMEEDPNTRTDIEALARKLIGS